MWKKRAIGWLIICLTGLFLLMVRLAEIQLVSTEHFSKHHINLMEASVSQRAQEIVIDNGRGNFLAEDGFPLSYEKKPVLILFPFLSKLDWKADKVAAILDVPEYELRAAVKKAEKPFAFGESDPLQLSREEMKAINDLKIPGVFAIEKKYDLKKHPAEQLIGLIGENSAILKKRYPEKKLPEQTLIGVSGLQSSFDEFLLPEGKSKLVYHVDGDGSPLFGLNVKYVDPANPFYPVNIRTTIDRKLQNKAEQLVDDYQIKNGGAVLLDIQTNSILAIVSRPMLNRKDPFKGEGVSNMMLKQQIPGSVFKTVVAAAAIDYRLTDAGRLFDCSRKINGKPDIKHRYGMLNFTDSFARSCNNTFGQLSKELKEIDPNILEQYADKLGLLGPVGWRGDVFHTNDFRQLGDEERGRVFLNEEAGKDENFAAMSGIGQHEVRVTPLGIANMMATIARGGKKESVRAASKVEYKNGTTMVNFEKKILKGETIAPYTAMMVQSLLREVVLNENGTGRWFKDLPFEVAGKSGTAETGVYLEGKQLHNKWFAGFFPYKNPRYALVTVNLQVPEDEGGINPLFADMVKAIAEEENSN